MRHTSVSQYCYNKHMENHKQTEDQLAPADAPRPEVLHEPPTTKHAWLSKLKRFWWVILIVVIIAVLGVWAVMYFVVHPKGSGDDRSLVQQMTGKYPACPSNLSGVLTHQLMDPKYIGAMIPLGNVSPPGHTSPVDHNYFILNSDDKVPLYAPADSWITHVMANSVKGNDGQYHFDSYVVTYTVCNGLVLDFAGYNDVNDALKAELSKHKDSCKYGITKVGHDNSGEGQCDYQNLNFKVKSGEQVGWTQRVKTAQGTYNIPFEIWAANYNKPARSDVQWDTYYGDNRYAHAVCTFDLYAGDLKNQFDARFGYWDQQVTKGAGAPVLGPGTLIRRTAEPVCGQVVQDVAGALQGMWFSAKLDKNDKSGNIGATGAGVSVIHNNIDPTIGEVVIGGEFDNNLTGVLAFKPTHSGTTNREPSEVKADGKVYCYQGDAEIKNINQPINGKILIQVLDSHHIRADHQTGMCGSNESIQTTYRFER